MIINDELISELEALTKIRLSDEEKTKIKTELSDMLSHMETLGELDTSGVEPLSHTLFSSGELREDCVKPSQDVDAVLMNAPDKTAGLFCVPKSFE